MKLTTLGSVLALLLVPGCDRMLVPVRHRTYGAWEEGLTLGYENPQLADAGQRIASRQMVRVKASAPGASGLAVTKTFSSLAGQWESRAVQRNGGIRLVTDAPGGLVMLPEGFPDRVSRWEARGSFNWVVGRATADLPGIRFADPSDAVGVWVESFVPGHPGNRTRTLYLPDLGEAETLSWDPGQGRWSVTNQLVTRGFTDVPVTTTANATGSTQ